MATKVDILINSRADLAGLRQASREADEFMQLIKAGVGIDLGARLVSGLSGVPSILQNAVKEGVQFNSTLEQSKLGIAAVLKQFQPERFQNFNDALIESGNAIDLLKKKAVESPASFQTLTQALQAVTGPATSAGIALNNQVDLVVNLSQALKGLGIREEQIIQETRALLTGNINADAAAARTLGITAEDISSAKKRGDLFEFLTGKISAFAEAGKLGAQTYDTALSNIGDVLTQVKGELTQPIFEELKKGLLDYIEALNTPEFKDALKPLAAELAILIKDGVELGKTAIENADKIAAIGRVIAGVIVVLAGLKITQITAGIAANAVALLSETTALNANSAAQASNAKSRGGKLVSLTNDAGNLTSVAGLASSLNIAVGLGLALNQIIFAVAGKIEAAAEEAKRLNEEFNRSNDEARALIFRQEVDITDPSRKRKVQVSAIDSTQSAEKASLRLNELILELEGKKTKEAAKHADLMRQYLSFVESFTPEELKVLDALKKQTAERKAQNELITKNQEALREIGALEERLDQADRDLKFSKLDGDPARLAFLQEERQALEQALKANGNPANLDTRDTDSLRKGKEALALKIQLKSLDQEIFGVESQIAETRNKDVELDAEAEGKAQRTLEIEHQKLNILNLRVAGRNQEADALQRSIDISDRAQALSDGSKGAGNSLKIGYEEAVALVTMQADAEEKLKQKQLTREAQLKGLQAQELDRARALADIQQQRSLVQGDPFLNIESKNALLAKLLEQERAELLKNIEAWEEYNFAQQDSDDPQVAENIRARSEQLAEAKDRIAEINNEVRTLSFEGNFQADLTSWVNGFGTTASQVAGVITNTLGSAINGVSQGITGLIMGTTSWQDAMRNTVSSVITNLVQVGVQMIAMNVLGKLLTTTTVATQTVAGGAIAAAHAPAAAATSVSSFGAAPAIGLIAATAAIIGIIALLSGGMGGFEAGGLIPGASSHKDNRLAMVASGEYVARTAAVNYYGPGVFEALNNMSLPRDWFHGVRVPSQTRMSSSFASGGLVGGGESLTPEVNVGGPKVNVAILNTRQEIKDFMGGEGQKLIFDAVSKRTVELGVRS